MKKPNQYFVQVDMSNFDKHVITNATKFMEIKSFIDETERIRKDVTENKLGVMDYESMYDAIVKIVNRETT